jgi:hypothetical protein
VKLPLMCDFLDILTPVRDLLESAGVRTSGRNFEEVHSEIAADGRRDLCLEVEALIYHYFSALRLPDHPTLYDRLVLSLRNKDVVATFNWDPFLIQAKHRNPILSGHGPQLLFLHGNVLAAFCEADSYAGPVGSACQRCGKPLLPSRLLYPIKEKDYDSDPMIAVNWKQVRADLEGSFKVTVFGYGAPASDVAAIRLLKDGLGDPEKKKLNQIEIIDIRSQSQVYDAWEPFIEIHNYHSKIHSSFDASSIALHPRRTGEAYIRQNIDGQFLRSNRMPDSTDWPELWDWVGALIERE